METPDVKPEPQSQQDAIINTVAWFAAEMRMKLYENRHKGGWRDCTTAYLLRRLLEEVGELVEAQADGRQISAEEAADVANFCMMLADPSRKPKRGT